MRCDAINVTVKAAQNAFFNFQLFSVSRLDHVYLGRWGKGVPPIWTVDPLKSSILLVLQLTR